MFEIVFDSPRSLGGPDCIESPMIREAWRSLRNPHSTTDKLDSIEVDQVTPQSYDLRWSARCLPPGCAKVGGPSYSLGSLRRPEEWRSAGGRE
jgi:hypothetical protein